jgi:hypothetical protein
MFNRCKQRKEDVGGWESTAHDQEGSVMPCSPGVIALLRVIYWILFVYPHAQSIMISDLKNGLSKITKKERAGWLRGNRGRAP